MEMIGILVFEDVEELDFVGPLEVFGTAARLGADCQVMITSEDGKPVRARSHRDARGDSMRKNPGKPNAQGHNIAGSINASRLLKSERIRSLLSRPRHGAINYSAGDSGNQKEIVNHDGGRWILGFSPFDNSGRCGRQPRRCTPRDGLPSLLRKRSVRQPSLSIYRRARPNARFRWSFLCRAQAVHHGSRARAGG